MKDPKDKGAQRIGEVWVLFLKAKLKAVIHHAFGKDLLQGGHQDLGHARDIPVDGG